MDRVYKYLKQAHLILMIETIEKGVYVQYGNHASNLES